LYSGYSRTVVPPRTPPPVRGGTLGGYPDARRRSLKAFLKEHEVIISAIGIVITVVLATIRGVVSLMDRISDVRIEMRDEIDAARFEMRNYLDKVDTKLDTVDSRHSAQMGDLKSSDSGIQQTMNGISDNVDRILDRFDRLPPPPQQPTMSQGDATTTN
jgi:hypothetical protein